MGMYGVYGMGKALGMGRKMDRDKDAASTVSAGRIRRGPVWVCFSSAVQCRAGWCVVERGRVITSVLSDPRPLGDDEAVSPAVTSAQPAQQSTTRVRRVDVAAACRPEAWVVQGSIQDRAYS